MRLKNLVAAMLLVSTGCAVRVFTEGKMMNGHIQPCAGNHTDAQACGNAIFNAPRLQQIQIGQTREEVLKIMEHPPERKDARMENGVSVEVWKYMQDYGQERMTAIVLVDGKVQSLNDVSWHD